MKKQNLTPNTHVVAQLSFSYNNQQNWHITIRHRWAHPSGVRYDISEPLASRYVSKCEAFGDLDPDSLAGLNKLQELGAEYASAKYPLYKYEG